MGNTIYSSKQSQPTDMKSLASQIDDIAVHYILKQNTIDLLRLTDKEYYDNLIVLVGNLFEKKLSDIEIGSLNQRIFPETIQDAVFNLLPTNGKVKDTMISNISKFYIKIMMIFSAIVSTIDPQYSYDDDTGKKQMFYLKDIKSYKNIPKHVQPVVHQLTNPMNLCRKRISILRNKIDSTDPDFITINPGEKLCSTDSASHLTDEIGIKELDLLYYDIFDPETKTWKSRSKTMDEKYREDLKRFYTIFTGKSELPPNINSFKDIELFDFRSMDYCKDTLFTHDFIIPKDNELILRYKEQVDLLEQSTNVYRAELLETLKKVFLTKIENENMSYTIQSTLTLQDILNIENETRNTIINLYTNCEQYFIRALLIFEELYDNQSKVMNESRMNNLEKREGNQPLYKENLFNVNSVPQQMPPLNMTPNNPMDMKSGPTLYNPQVQNSFVPNPPASNVPGSNGIQTRPPVAPGPPVAPVSNTLPVQTPQFDTMAPLPDLNPPGNAPGNAPMETPIEQAPVVTPPETPPPVEPSPVETPVETPVESPPVEQSPSETPSNVPMETPSETPPVEPIPAETPAETPPIVPVEPPKTPLETPPLETPIESPPVEPIETKPADSVPVNSFSTTAVTPTNTLSTPVGAPPIETPAPPSVNLTPPVQTPPPNALPSVPQTTPPSTLTPPVQTAPVNGQAEPIKGGESIGDTIRKFLS